MTSDSILEIPYYFRVPTILVISFTCTVLFYYDNPMKQSVEHDDKHLKLLKNRKSRELSSLWGTTGLGWGWMGQEDWELATTHSHKMHCRVILLNSAMIRFYF